MSAPLSAPARADLVITDCWNWIGVRGDRSCPELTHHVHCHNCPVFTSAALTLLEAEAPDEYTTERSTHFAARQVEEATDTESIVIFRIGGEWLALPTPVIQEIAAERTIHSLPHRRGGTVLGVTNIHGEIVVCVSLGRVLGLDESIDSTKHASRSTRRRFLVIRRDDLRVVCPVSEVSGIHHVARHELKDPPRTVAKTTAYSKNVMAWRDHSVGVLDAQLLFYTLKRSLA